MRYSNPKNNWVEALRKMPLWAVAVILLSSYTILNLVFTQINYYYSTLDTIKQNEPNYYISFYNYLYYSFVTSSTVGYGDFYPRNDIGKFVAILQTIFSVFIFTISASLIFVKLLYPRNTIIFANRIFYNKDLDCFSFRLININKSYMINPELRVVLATHCEEGGISHYVSLNVIDKLCWLDNHDMYFDFKNVTASGENVLDELNKARTYNITNEDSCNKSRFCIKISIQGNYGFQGYSHCKQYNESDIITGSYFQRISYFDNKGKHTIKYSKIPNFWERFNEIR